MIRLATAADIEALTDLHCACFRPEQHVPVMLGRHYVRATYRWQVSDPRAYVLVAEFDRQLIGLVSVSDGPYARPMFLACLPQFVRSLIQHPGLLLKRRLWQRLLRRPHVRGSPVAAPGLAELANIAVDAHYRGKGVFPALVDAAREHSHTRGARAIRAGVYKANPASQRAFARAGWIETRELETDDTVSYVAHLDPAFPADLGFTRPDYPG